MSNERTQQRGPKRSAGRPKGAPKRPQQGSEDTRCNFYYANGERCGNHRKKGGKNPAMCYQHQNERVKTPTTGAPADKGAPQPTKNSAADMSTLGPVPNARFMADVLSKPGAGNMGSYTAVVPSNDLGSLLDSIQDDLGVSDSDMRFVTIRQNDPRFVFVAVPESLAPGFDPAPGSAEDIQDAMTKTMASLPERRIVPKGAWGSIGDDGDIVLRDEYDRPKEASWSDVFRPVKGGGGLLEAEIDPSDPYAGNAVLAGVRHAGKGHARAVIAEEGDGEFKVIVTDFPPKESVRCRGNTASGQQCWNIVAGGEELCVVHRGDTSVSFYEDARQALVVQQGGVYDGSAGGADTVVIEGMNAGQFDTTDGEFAAVSVDSRELLDAMDKGAVGRPLTPEEQSLHQDELDARGERDVDPEATREIYKVAVGDEGDEFGDIFDDDDDSPEAETGPKADPGDDPNDPMTRRRQAMEDYAGENGATVEYLGGEEPVWNIGGMMYSLDGVYLGTRQDGGPEYQGSMFDALKSAMQSRQTELRGLMDFTALDSVGAGPLPARFSPHGPYTQNVPDDTPESELARRRRSGERFAVVNDRDGNEVVVLSNGDIFNADGSLRMRSGADVPEIGTIPARQTAPGQWSNPWAPDPASREALNYGRESARPSAAASRLLSVRHPAMNKLGARSVSRRTAARQIDSRCSRDPEFARQWAQMDVSQQMDYLSSMENWYVHRYNIETRMKHANGGRGPVRRRRGIFDGLIDFMSSLPSIVGRGGVEASSNAAGRLATGR
jgi:hypothetical protein